MEGRIAAPLAGIVPTQDERVKARPWLAIAKAAASREALLLRTRRPVILTPDKWGSGRTAR